GSLDAMLLRPRGIAMQLVLSDFDPRRLGSIAVGLIVLFRVLPSLSITWSALNVLLFIFAIIGCVFLLMGLFFLDAAFCFVTLRSTEAVNVLTYGGRTCCQYPVDIYPGPLKVLFLYLAPLGLCLHVPLAALLGKPLSPLPPLSPAVSLLCSLLGPLFFACMYLLFRLALHRYASAGA
ncbi:MAG: ABC-2 family transporter protein, partial [Clostridia bacterium]|nr:ABC-2 family transporter protein [Clostridia bacterium]